MNKLKRLIGFSLITLVSISLASCDFNLEFHSGPSVKTETKNKIEEYQKSYINEFNNGVINVTIDNKTMEYNDAIEYAYRNYQGSTYQSYLNNIYSQLNDYSNKMSEIYINYVAEVNDYLSINKLDFYEYKSEELNAYISKKSINDIISIVDRLDQDTDILNLLVQESPKKLQLTNFAASKNCNLGVTNTADYLNAFAENYVSMDFMSQNSISTVSNFLSLKDVTLERTNNIDYEGKTVYEENVPVELIIKQDSDIIKMLGTMSHEIGHVSDSLLSSLDIDEILGCATETLSYYYGNTFNFYSDNDLASKYYQQRVLFDTVNSFYGWVDLLRFFEGVYSSTNLSNEALLNIMDNTYYPSKDTYDDIVWKIRWTYLAYYDLANQGSFVYTYGAINSCYLWNLYKTNQADAVDKYRALVNFEGNFKNLNSIGLIGESNISEAYTSIKNLIIEDINLFLELNGNTFI